jgi:hypothetical protein
MERPATAGGGIQTNAQTFAVIMKQLKGSSQLVLNEVIRTDLKEYSEEATQLPIVKFIKKYGSGALRSYLTAVVYTTIPRDKTQVHELNRDTMTKFVKALNRVPRPDGNVMYLRRFMFEFFDSYVHQYKIEGATSIETKIALVYEDFKLSFNIDLERSVKLFTALGLTQSALQEYSTQPPPKTVPPMTLKPGANTRYISSSSFRGGGESDHEDEFSEEE